MLPGRATPRIVVLSAFLFACSLGWACKGTERITDVPSQPRPTHIVVFPPDINFPEPGLSLQVTATLKDQNGFSLSGLLVSWESSDKSVATVDRSGMVEAVSHGECTITAVHEGLRAASLVRVQ